MEAEAYHGHEIPRLLSDAPSAEPVPIFKMGYATGSAEGVSCVQMSRLCPHPKREFRKRFNSKGVLGIWHQCLNCGSSPGLKVETSEQTKKSLFTKAQIDAMPMFDENIGKAFFAAREKEVEREKIAWWERYKIYLDSPQWADKRARVLRRDNGICRWIACTRKAVHVHHLSYERVGDESMDDLVSICLEHHAEIHPHRNLNRSMRFSIGERPVT